MQQSKILSEEKFVKLLLMLLCKNGIFKVNEDELSKKLYFYYLKRREYEKLFEDVSCCSNCLNIKDGINHEKYFAKNICFTEKRPEKLFLLHDASVEEDELIKEFSIEENILSLMEKLATEITIATKIENRSKIKMNIFNHNPNQTYNLTAGKYHSKVISWELITNGIIKETKPINLKMYENCFLKEPGSKTSNLIKLNVFQGKTVTIKDASYAILQGKNDNKLKEIEIYTEQINKDYLENISEIARRLCNEEDGTENEIVKMLILK